MTFLSATFILYLNQFYLIIFVHLHVHTGFSRKRQYDTAAQSIYHRAAKKKNNGATVTVSTAKPIVFVHGIGR